MERLSNFTRWFFHWIYFDNILRCLCRLFLSFRSPTTSSSPSRLFYIALETRLCTVRTWLQCFGSDWTATLFVSVMQILTRSCFFWIALLEGGFVDHSSIASLIREHDGRLRDNVIILVKEVSLSENAQRWVLQWHRERTWAQSFVTGRILIICGRKGTGKDNGNAKN